MQPQLYLQPMGFPSFGMDPSTMSAPEVSKCIPTIEGYRVIQDDSFPENAIVMNSEGVVAWVELTSPRPASHYGYETNFNTTHELVVTTAIDKTEFNVRISIEHDTYAKELYAKYLENGVTPLLRYYDDTAIKVEGFVTDTDFIDNLLDRLTRTYKGYGLEFYRGGDFFESDVTNTDNPSKKNTYLIAVVDSVSNRLIGYVSDAVPPEAGVDDVHCMILATTRHDLIEYLL